MSFASSFNCPTVPLWRCCSLSLWAPESLASLVRDICQPPACFIAPYSIQCKNISSEMLTTQTNISLKIKAGLSPLSTAFFFSFFFYFSGYPTSKPFLFFSSIFLSNNCGFQSARGCHIGVYQKFHWLSSYLVLGCTVRFCCISGATAERPWHCAMCGL